MSIFLNETSILKRTIRITRHRREGLVHNHLHGAEPNIQNYPKKVITAKSGNLTEKDVAEISQIRDKS